MFIELTEAQKVNPTATQSDIDALEEMVRAISNNGFEMPATRRHFVRMGLAFGPDSITMPNLNGQPLQGSTDFLRFIREKDSVEVYGTGVNDGVYEVKQISSATITFRMPEQMPEFVQGAFDTSLVKVSYPFNVRRGALQLLKYDATVGSKIGIKQETISRYSTTYFDMTAAESQAGYPKSLIDFLHPYRKIKFD